MERAGLRAKRQGVRVLRMTSETFRTLLDTALVMDPDASRRDRFEQMFAAQYAHVLAYALRRAPRTLAEDAVSDTFLVAWKRLDAVTGDPLPWLLAVTRRTLANQRRAASRADALVTRLTAEQRTAEHLDYGVAIVGDPRLERAMSKLSRKEREALLLIAWEGLSAKQAAQAAECSHTAFRLRLHRARKRLSLELTCRNDDESESRLEPVATTRSRL